MQIIEKHEIEQITGLDLEALAAVEAGFRALARGEVEMPPVLSLAVRDFNGEVDVKTAYVKSLDHFAIKISPGFFDNPKLGLPSLNGLMILFAARTGIPQAILLDQGYLTMIRTALAGAIAAKYLSNPDAHSVAIIGAGEQARMQARALKLVRPVDTLRVWARDADKGHACCEDLSDDFKAVRYCGRLDQAIQEADIAVTTTPSVSPLLTADLLTPGMHITAMGSDQHGKQELDYAVLLQADAVVVDRRSQSERLGELQHRHDRALPSRLFELGEIIEQGIAVRSSASDTTVCDLTGTGVQDTAIASYTFAKGGYGR